MIRNVFNFRSLICMALLFCASSAQAYNTAPETDASGVTSEFYRFENYFNALQAAQPQNIPDAIRILPEAHKKNFTLAYNSYSLHEASLLGPRAFLFGDTAHLIVTFNNGHEMYSGKDAIETAEMSAEGIIRYREILFKKDYDPAKRNDYLEDNLLEEGDIAFENDVYLVTKPNPAKCLQCHTPSSTQYSIEIEKPHDLRRAKYNWDSYPQWPGFYGGEDDRLISVKDLNSAIQSEAATYHRAFPPEVLRKIKKFYAPLLKAHPYIVFKYLVAPHNERYNQLDLYKTFTFPYYHSADLDEDAVFIGDIIPPSYHQTQLLIETLNGSGQLPEENLSQLQSELLNFSVENKYWHPNRNLGNMPNARLTALISIHQSSQDAQNLYQFLSEEKKTYLLNKLCFLESDETYVYPSDWFDQFYENKVYDLSREFMNEMSLNPRFHVHENRLSNYFSGLPMNFASDGIWRTHDYQYRTQVMLRFLLLMKPNYVWKYDYEYNSTHLHEGVYSGATDAFTRFLIEAGMSFGESDIWTNSLEEICRSENSAETEVD